MELFTSEGCSSCPPADAALARLLRTQPLPEVEVILLSEHVDYWDSSAWRDPFSSHEATLRQERYAEQFGNGRIYTPQAVVGGRLDVLGSDEAGLRTALLGLSSQAHGTVVLSKKAAGEDALAFRVDAAGLPAHGAADVMLALVEDGLVSKVVGGEKQRQNVGARRGGAEAHAHRRNRGRRLAGRPAHPGRFVVAEERPAPRRLRAGARYWTRSRRRQRRNRVKRRGT